MKTLWVNNFVCFGSDLGMTYPQQNQLFGNTDGRLDTANVLSLENAFNFFLFPHAVLTALHMSLTAKELLTNQHEIHFVSTQLGTSVIQHLLLNISSAFSSSTSKQLLRVVTVKHICLLIFGS